MDVKSAARTAMAAKLIADTVATEHKPLKADLLRQMADVGIERVRVLDDDGVDLGPVIVVSGRGLSAKVSDPAAFLAWVVRRYPSEIVQAVRQSFTDKLLAYATDAGAPVDEQGEEIPGVEMVTGDPYLTVRPTAHAKQRMRDALLSSGLLRLPAGGEAT